MALFLIDGHALAYRSYYAFVRRPLVNSKGEETSAVFGFLKTIINVFDKFDPTHLAVVFDSSETTFRNDLFADYKANRPKMPVALAEQFPRILAVLDAMNIPLLSSEGYEADDVIATVTDRLESRVPIWVISGDKDLFQLVSERTRLVRPGKGGLLDEMYDVARLEAKYGLRPDQFVDFQALMGDATDNVPGVAGIGEKTALRLILEFESLDAIYERLAEIPSKSLRDKLARGEEDARLSRELVLLERAVPIDVSIENLERRAIDRTRLVPLLEELEFTLTLDSLAETSTPEEPQRAVRYETVETESQLERLSETLARSGEFALDVETSGLDAMSAVLAGVSFSTDEGVAWYVPVESLIDEEPGLLVPPRKAPGLPLESVRKWLGDVLGNPAVEKIGQNIKFDTIVLNNAGLDVQGISFDTMLASYTLDPGRRGHGLDSLVKEFFHHPMIPFKSLFEGRSKRRDIRLVPLQKVSDYACEDADYTLRLKKRLAEMIENSQVGELFAKVEMPLSGVLARMEMCGVALDVGHLEELSRRLAGRLEELERAIYDEAGEQFNINSTAKLQELLFRKLGLKPTSKTKTGYSTDIDVLKGLASQHPLPGLVIDYRVNHKLKTTYVDALPKLVNSKTGRLHTSYNQAVASTGRLSSSDPNLQNIPIRTPMGREIRKAFVPTGTDWLLLDADYSQIELRLMAHLSQDTELLQAFSEDADVHRRTAARIMGVSPDEVTPEMRARAKTVNFGVMYGMGARGLAQSLEIDVGEAREFIEDYFSKYPGVRRFIDSTVDKARREGAVSTLLGRVRQLPGLASGDPRTRAFAERTAVNTPIQGSAADVIKVAMVDIDARLREKNLGARLILQVHDELLLDVPKDELDDVAEIVRTAMEGAIALDVPLVVDMGHGTNWLEAHD